MLCNGKGVFCVSLSLQEETAQQAAGPLIARRDQR
jgi:hypothetical protein